MNLVNPGMRMGDQGMGKGVQQVHPSHQWQFREQPPPSFVRLVPLAVGQVPLGFSGNAFHSIESS